MKILLKFFAPIMVLFFFIYVPLACSEDDSIPTTNEEIDSLSLLLIALIEEHSETGEIDYFILPHSTEYDKIPADPMNPITAEKVELGMMLYHETATAIHPKDPKNYQTYSCASCHPADCEYQPGIEQGIGEGGLGYGSYGEGRVRNPACAVEDLDVQPIKTPTALNMAYSNVALWNGSLGAHGVNEGTDDLWTVFPQTINHEGFLGIESQSLVGLEVHRVGIDESNWVETYGYKKYFDAAYPEIAEEDRYTNRNMALAIAAYERTMTSSKAPFQDFLRGDYSSMTDSQKEGALIFFGKGACVTCHKNPAFGNDKMFVSLGLNDLDPTTNFLITEQLGRGAFTKDPTDNYKFRVPQLYNLMGVLEYGHGSSMHSLREMIMYCAAGVPENENVPEEQISKGFVDRGLSKLEIDHLEDFLRNGLYDAEIKRHQPDRIMSGFCFPNADAQSKIDFGYSH